MTNSEKARERARQVFPCPNEDEQRRIVELAYNDACNWKDQQFKEYLEKKMVELSSRRAEVGVVPVTCQRFIMDIINELFGGE